jgi:hypothetical protein
VNTPIGVFGVPMANLHLMLWFMIKQSIYRKKEVKMKMLKIALVASILVVSSFANSSVINLATSGTASQSTTDWGGVSERAIDGNTNGLWWNDSVTSTDHNFANSWWEVDLGQLSTISEIVLWNRTDGWGDRLNNFEIFLDGVILFSTASSPFSVPAPSFSFSVGGLDGQTVRIQKFADTGGNGIDPDGTGGSILSLAEVQVFGVALPITSPAVVSAPSALSIFALGLMGLGFRKATTNT